MVSANSRASSRIRHAESVPSLQEVLPDKQSRLDRMSSGRFPRCRNDSPNRRTWVERQVLRGPSERRELSCDF